MKYKILTVPATGRAESEEVLNQFVASVKVINISKELIANAEQSFWSFCIYYSDIPAADKKPKSRSRKPTVDYREILNDEQFTVYAQLREVRKTLSEHWRASWVFNRSDYFYRPVAPYHYAY